MEQNRPAPRRALSPKERRRRHRIRLVRNWTVFLLSCGAVMAVMTGGILWLLPRAYALIAPPTAFEAREYEGGAETDLSDKRLMLVNANLPLTEEPTPELAVADDATGVSLEAEAAAAYREMAEAAKQDEIELVLTAGYQDAAARQSAYEAAVQSYRESGCPEEEAVARAATVQPAPEASEYATGYGADILAADSMEKDTGFADTRAYEWLEAYAADHPELCIVDEFVDDGYSGSNFERPAFQNLFRELEQGTINCILVKDLSRFGRNYIEVGRYLERIFPVMRVRLIAVTDNYDSQSAWKTSDSIMVPMRNLLNDAYCRDISIKIKSQLAVKRKRGDFVGSFATYGYQKDPSNHTKLIVDELAAETVQNIFHWKINGMSNQGIANRLNAKKVSSPAARKLQSGAKLSLHFRKSDEPPWSAKAVDRILHNEVYIGKLVQGKTRRLDYRSKKKMNVPMRDWVIVDNTHEAIIPAEQFELVQRILETETSGIINSGFTALTLTSRHQ